jgi:hypothetical protein
MEQMFDVGEQTGMAAARAHFEAGLALLASQDIDPIAPLQLGCDIKALRGVIDRLEAQCARRVELFDRDRGYAPSGDGSATNWLRHHCNMSGATADRHVKFARQLPDLEKTQQALESGQIGIEHALEIARATEDMGAAAEGELLEAARSKDPVEVRQVAKELRTAPTPRAWPSWPWPSIASGACASTTWPTACWRWRRPCLLKAGWRSSSAWSL